MSVAVEEQDRPVDQLQSRTTKLALLLSGLGAAKAAPSSPSPGPQVEPRPAVRVDLYLRELESLCDQADANEMARAVKQLDTGQIERVVEARAAQHARYIAVLLEITRGGRSRRALDDVAIRDLRRHREAFEELNVAFRSLRNGIAEGTIVVEGLID